MNERFSREELDIYEACTALSGAEVELLYDKFVCLMRDKRGKVRLTRTSEGGPPKAKLQRIIAQEELANNPFSKRFCQIFSSEPPFNADGTPNEAWGDLSFDEYVDLYNCLSPRASREIKAKTAFRVYDFDNNGYLSIEDIKDLIVTLATPEAVGGTPASCLFTPAEVDAVAERVMRDCDVDGNMRLSFTEFFKMIEKVPEFPAKFSIMTADTEPAPRAAAETAITGEIQDPLKVPPPPDEDDEDDDEDAEDEDDHVPERPPPSAGRFQRTCVHFFLLVVMLAAVGAAVVFMLPEINFPWEQRRLLAKDEA